MSKSKYNLVDPETILQTYGADAARVFMLSDTPPERDLEWTEAGIDGAWRYINRLWRMALACPGKTAKPETFSAAADKLIRMAHKTIAAVTEDLNKLRFNVAVARLRELTNALGELKLTEDGDKYAYRFAFETLVRLIAPIAPHIAEEMWHFIGNETLLAEQRWPVADAALAADDKITMAVQVMGKMRGTIEVAKDSDDEAVKEIALALPTVKAQLEGKTIRKIIVVKNKIVNVVAA